MPAALHTHHAALLLGWRGHLVLAGVVLCGLLWALELQAGGTDGQDVVTGGRLAVEVTVTAATITITIKNSQGCSSTDVVGVEGACYSGVDGCTMEASIPHAAASTDNRIHAHLGAAVLNAGSLCCRLCGVKLPVGRAGEGLTWRLDR